MDKARQTAISTARRKRGGKKGSLLPMLGVTAAALLAGGASAFATPITVSGSYDISYGATHGDGPAITHNLKDPFTVRVPLNGQANAIFITLTPSKVCGTGCVQD